MISALRPDARLQAQRLYRLRDPSVVVKVTLPSGTMYYDPSYGRTYTSQADFENKSVQAFWTLERGAFNENTYGELDGDGITSTNVMRWFLLFTPNPTYTG